MDMLLDFLPIALFFAAYQFAGIYAATAVAIAASVIQLAVAWFLYRRIKPMLWVSAGLVIVFGSLTLVFNNPEFIKWKPTVLYWLFAVTLVVAAHGMGRNLIRKLLETHFALPEPYWTRLNLAWAVFFAALGALNIFVAHHFSEAVWVKFKLFGLLGLTIVFALAQTLLISRYAREDIKP